MSFSTVLFFAFLIVGLVVYYVLPKKLQWIWLLIISYAYYFSYSVKTSVFLVFTTLVTYAGARLLDKFNTEGKEYIAANKQTMSKEEKKTYKEKLKKKKRLVVWAMIVLAFGLLAAVKYGNFIITNIDALVLAIGHGQYFNPPSIILPLGISFYTFQSFSYIVDVYHAKYAAEKNVFKYALFVSFFPQLLQGPIGRFDRLAHQLYEGHSFELKRIEFGIQRVMWGLFKKMVLADRVAGVVSEIFTNYASYGGWYNIVAVLLYSIQLYADFSGGIDIVIGTAQMFGITMDENFRQPFFSRSISEFWRRWHITLGTWMKDYIFYPFSLSKCMNKFGKWCKKHIGSYAAKTLPVCLADILVFFVVGIWHGAEWKYIMYGLYNGFIMAFSSFAQPAYNWLHTKTHIDKDSKGWKLVQIIRTFILVNIGFYFDMAPGMVDALVMIKQSITGFSLSQVGIAAFKPLGMESRDFVIVLAGCIIIFIVSIIKEKGISVRESLAAKPVAIRWAVYYGLIIFTLVFGATAASTGFLYANF